MPPGRSSADACKSTVSGIVSQHETEPLRRHSVSHHNCCARNRLQHSRPEGRSLRGPGAALRSRSDVAQASAQHWVMGNTIGVSVDASDHVWIIHRAGSLEAKEIYAVTNPPGATCCLPAPPVLEFDQEGNLIGHWGGPGQGYDWPESNHGITIDYKGNVWIGGNGRGNQAAPPPGGAPDESAASATRSYNDNMVLKFTQDGSFLMQIGKPNSSKGSNDIANLRLPAKIFVDAKTNEAYIADGYGNHRVIVFDADTGKYKRHWGAYGHKPDDTDMGRYNPNDPPAQQFRNPVHCAELSSDNQLYVCDRVNDRIQVFKPDGTFIKEAF